MTDPQLAFLSTVKVYEQKKEELEKVRVELEESLKLLQVGEFLQDPATKLVYQICVPKGRFMYYETVSYTRTAKPEESAGSLSKKAAIAAGFTL